MLRIDPTADGDAPYTIPADNPFVGVDGADPEIWSVGLRNPWRFSFDRATGDLWIADVGQNGCEEIDVAWAADGWRPRASTSAGARSRARTASTTTSRPTAPRPRSTSTSTATTAARSAAAPSTAAREIPALVGWYVYGDYCSGQIQGLRVENRALAQVLPLTTQSQNTAIRVGPDGELWAISIGGQVARIVAG